MTWISITDALPQDGERVLAFIPNFEFPLPGKTGEMVKREVMILHFQKNFFIHDPQKLEKHGAHFWKGEGHSNQYFNAVSHWMPLPKKPNSFE
ncbi:MAG: DUF551 domain-containing protein [Bacteroidota bacterium]|jgi:Protein of unknown function (DUF551)